MDIVQRGRRDDPERFGPVGEFVCGSVMVAGFLAILLVIRSHNIKMKNLREKNDDLVPDRPDAESGALGVAGISEGPANDLDLKEVLRHGIGVLEAMRAIFTDNPRSTEGLKERAGEEMDFIRDRLLAERVSGKSELDNETLRALYVKTDALINLLDAGKLRPIPETAWRAQRHDHELKLVDLSAEYRLAMAGLD